MKIALRLTDVDADLIVSLLSEKPEAVGVVEYLKDILSQNRDVATRSKIEKARIKVEVKAILQTRKLKGHEILVDGSLGDSKPSKEWATLLVEFPHLYNTENESIVFEESCYDKIYFDRLMLESEFNALYSSKKRKVK